MVFCLLFTLSTIIYCDVFGMVHQSHKYRKHHSRTCLLVWIYLLLKKKKISFVFLAGGLNFRVNLNRKLETRKRTESLYSESSVQFRVVLSALSSWSRSTRCCCTWHFSDTWQKMFKTSKTRTSTSLKLGKSQKLASIFLVLTLFSQQRSPCCSYHLSPFKEPCSYFPSFHQSLLISFPHSFQKAFKIPIP